MPVSISIVRRPNELPSLSRGRIIVDMFISLREIVRAGKVEMLTVHPYRVAVRRGIRRTLSILKQRKVLVGNVRSSAECSVAVIA